MSLTGRKVFLTGASGFIGARLVQTLLRDHGANVTVGVRGAKRARIFSGLDVQVKRARLENRHELDAAIRDRDIVFNLAYDFRQSAKANVLGFENLIDSCVALGSKRLVHVSTIAVYDNWPKGDFDEESPSEMPGSEYKNAKMEMERILVRRAQRNELESVILQPTIVYGPRSRFWTDMIVEQMLSGTVVFPAQATGLCNAVYVDDMANAMTLAALGKPSQGERFIVSGSEPVLWRDFFESYAAILKTDSLRYVEAADLSHSTSNGGASRRTWLGNPLRIAETWPVRGALNVVRSTLGSDVIERLRAAVQRVQRRRGGAVYYPDPGALSMYLHGGRCSIERAKSELHYLPKYDFAAGMRLTADYIARTYL